MKMLWPYLFLLSFVFCANLGSYCQEKPAPDTARKKKGLFNFEGVEKKEDAEELHVDHDILKTSFVTIRDVIITGNRITKDYIITREVPMKKGQRYTISDILQNRQLARINLMNTTLFNEATVDFTNWNNDSMDILVDVKERWYYFPVPYFKPVDRNWNVWINDYNASFSRVNYGLKFTGNNVSGRNDKMNLFLVNGYTQQVLFNYSLPYLDKELKHGALIEFAYGRNREIQYATLENEQAFYQNEDDFVRDQLRFGIGYTYRRKSIARHTVRLSYTVEKIADTVSFLNPKYFGEGRTTMKYPELYYSYDYYKVDYIPYPLRGWTYNINFTQRGLSKEMHLTQLAGRVNWYGQMAHRTYLSLAFYGAVKFPFDQPYYNQRLLGFGDAYLRGLEYYIIDGVAGGIGRVSVRRELFTIKWRTGLKARSYAVVPFRFFLKLYGDAGYGYARDKGNNFLNNKFLYTGGIGIDMLTIHDFVMRFEFSFNQLGEKGLFLHGRSDF